jgi:hypothetical protein
MANLQDPLSFAKHEEILARIIGRAAQNEFDREIIQNARQVIQLGSGCEPMRW